MSKSVLTAKDLHKKYKLGRDNYVHALRGASLEVEKGEMVGVMGPSGSGKSTLLHILGCLDRPDSGEVYLGTRPVHDLRGGALNQVRRTGVGFVFQGFNLVPTMTARENVAIAAEYAGASRRKAVRAAERTLEVVGLADRIDHKPNQLSGGQQQRVAIARALVNDPLIVLGDEPTGDLDTATSEEIITTMRRLNTEIGTTFVLVTHDPEVGAACDRIIEVRDGVVLDGAEATLPAGARRVAPKRVPDVQPALT